MQFTNSFNVPLPLEEAWRLVLDVPTILPCLPGAKLTEVLGKDKYEGSVVVRLGPVKLAFDGIAEIVERDETNHIAYLKGRGTDPKGRGSAESSFNFKLEEVSGDKTSVLVTTDLALSGAVAQYGRGTGMIGEVAAQILKQFEFNLSRLVDGGFHVKEESDQTVFMGRDARAAATQPAASSTTVDVSVASSVASALSVPATSVDAVQAQALLAQSQMVLAQVQAVLLKTGLLVPAKRAEFKAAELNMLKIGLSAFWARLKYAVGIR